MIIFKVPFHTWRYVYLFKSSRLLLCQFSTEIKISLIKRQETNKQEGHLRELVDDGVGRMRKGMNVS